MKTNAELYQDIIDKLEFEPSLDASEIAVRIEGDIVTLSGTVGNFWEKHAAERAVKNVSGVKGIANDLQIKLRSFWEKSDTDIAQAAVNALKWNVVVPKDCIQVSVENGAVSLTGNVSWNFQRDAAEKAVRGLLGVKSLNNLITLQTPVEPKDVKDRIYQEFRRHAQLDADKVQVEIAGNKVKLKGNVRSWAELEEAKHAAWSVPGVTAVDSQLFIKY
ncbi:MAG: BON domain-containing protein [Burkholderiaceae bacterium]|nr:BON domain-containing protein [Burkholderiaceae bacterium]